jgi:hypothetical protein
LQKPIFALKVRSERFNEKHISEIYAPYKATRGNPPDKLANMLIQSLSVCFTASTEDRARELL